jgi:type VI secretion system protein ImpL
MHGQLLDRDGAESLSPSTRYSSPCANHRLLTFMLRKSRIDLVSIVLLVVLPGLAIWFKGEDWLGLHSPEHRAGWIVTLCILFVVLFAWGSFDASSRPAVAARRIRHWVRQQLGAASPSANTQTPDEDSRPGALRDTLRERHGWRWRYRDRWVAVSGDEALIKRLSPDLAQNGFRISGDTVLLYAKQVGDQVDTTWLDQIRHLRRRRPIDAMVAVVRTAATANQPFDAGLTAQLLARNARALRWAAPAYLLNATEFDSETSNTDEAIGCTWSGRARAEDVDASLRGLISNLADAGVLRLTKNRADRYPAELSQHIARYGSALSGLVAQIGQSRTWRNAVQGVLFAPLSREHLLVATQGDETNSAEPRTMPQGYVLRGAPEETDFRQSVWQTIAAHSRLVHGRRVGFSLSVTTAWILTAATGFWIAGTILSGVTNRATLQSAADTLTQFSIVQDPTQSALTLDRLQKQIDTLEIRQHDEAPWYTRFGLNRDRALLATLWPAYGIASSRILVQPIQTRLEGKLQHLASLSDAEIASGGEAQVKAAYATLKTYLMLAKPERADETFLKAQLLATDEPARSASSALSYGAWEDLRQRLIGFYAAHLGERESKDRPSLAITPDASLVNATRQTVIGVIGLQNSTDVIYQQILDENRSKYPALSLTTLLGEITSRGLFNTTATVAGVFTREAWDERISKAIDEASKNRGAARDWVLSDGKTDTKPTELLKAELRQRYFADYASAWQQFLNSIRWQPDTTLSGTVDQLTLLADPQRSPLAALMNVVVYQAAAGTVTQSLSDSMITRAQQLVGKDEKDPSKIALPQNAAPLAAAFGPLLRLSGSDLAGSGNPAGNGNGNGKATTQITSTGDLSVPRYLERVTAMRLKLQQTMASRDPDAMSRTAAQAVLQGKTSDIADSRDYASRVAASLGEQWAGFGGLFDAPLEQTWQVVLQPAASSLNDTWRSGIVSDWDRLLKGRYPFANSDNDASLPEMARFMRQDSGVIAQFVTTQLAGIIERQGDRWVLAQGANHGALTVDPEFLAALNTLTRASAVLFPSGDANVRYELRAVATPGITDVRFVLSGRELHYFNQKEEWTPFIWPGDSLENITHVEWQTQQGGVRSAFDTQGRFGLIRLLERATVTPLDSARYLLSWTPDQSLGVPLRVILRSDAGAGPLEVLKLRRFSLPSRIFLTGSAKDKTTGASMRASAGPPPLPPEALEAAAHAAMPLPGGQPSLLPPGPSPSPSPSASGAPAKPVGTARPQAAKAVAVKNDPWSKSAKTVPLAGDAWSKEP